MVCGAGVPRLGGPAPDVGPGTWRTSRSPRWARNLKSSWPRI